MEYEQIIAHLSLQGAFYIYLVVFLGSMIENFFPPLPGDLIILAGAFLAGRGEVAYLPVFIVSVSGGFVGAIVVYYFGKSKGRAFVVSRNKGLLSQRNLQKTEDLFARWGSLILLLSRFIAGVRPLIALTAGIGGVAPLRMAGFTLASFCIWNLLLVGGMYIAKSNWAKLIEIIKTYNIIFIIFSLCILFFWLVIYRKGRIR